MDRTGFGKGMCFRLLYTLRHCGFIAKTDGNRYRLTSEIRRRKRYRIGYASQGQDSSFVHEVHRGLLKRRRARTRRAHRRRQPLSAESRPQECGAADPRRRRSGHRVPDRRVGGAGDCGEVSRGEDPARSRSTSRIRARPTSAPTTTRPGLLAGRYLGKCARQCWNGHADEILLVELARAGSLPAARIRGAVAGIREVIHEAANWSVVSIDGDGQFKTALERVRGTCARRMRSASWSRPPTIRARSAPRARSKRPDVPPTAPSRGRTPNRMRAPSCAASRRRSSRRSAIFRRSTATD